MLFTIRGITLYCTKNTICHWVLRCLAGSNAQDVFLRGNQLFQMEYTAERRQAVKSWIEQTTRHILANMKATLILTLGSLLALAAGGQDFNNIEYLCCDWGPAMTLPTKTNEVVQFNDAEDEVYFIKQIAAFTRKKSMLGGRAEDIGKGLSIWLCKMKADGSAKTEIKELWKNPAYPIDTQMRSTWMSVNAKTRTIALSIYYAGSDLTGLWTVKLDGSELHRIINPREIEGYLQAVDRPSWTPDGQWIVFGESLRGKTRGRIVKCDRKGEHSVYLSDGPTDGQPCLSPDGNKIVYVVISSTKGGLWIMNADGVDAHLLPNPNDKRRHHHGGVYPTWSPDGKRIFYMGYVCQIVDALTGIEVFDNVGLCGWPHWGRTGLVGFNVGGILFTDVEQKKDRWLAGSGMASGPDRDTAAVKQ
jgi:hypothetical protein